MSRKRKRKTPAPKRAAAPPSEPREPRERIYSFRLRLEVTALELASGHDGLLRGMPEPVIVLGAFLIAGGRATPLGRMLVRLKQPQGRFPTVVTPPEPAVLRTKGRGSSTTRIAVLGLAIEEDVGKDVERIYAHLAEAKHVRVWTLEDAVPSPVALAELAPSASASVPAPAPAPPAAPAPTVLNPVATRVGVVVEGADLRDACTEDDFVGASLFLIPTTVQEDGVRLHFTSADQLNDWTALLTVSVE